MLPSFKDFLSFSYGGDGRDVYLASQMKFRVLERVINILRIAQFRGRDSPVPNNVAISSFSFFFFILREQKNLLHFGGFCLVFFLFSLASSEPHWWFWKITTKISQSTTQPC